jgi:hypothetical protein
MKKINTRLILPSVTTLLGILWTIVGIAKYGWWSEKGPTSGFFPIIIGALLALLSIFAIFKEKNVAAPVYVLKSIYPLLAVIGVIFAAMLIGFFPAMFLYLFIWLKLYEKYKLLFSSLTSIFTTGTMYGIFVMWLRVPFPTGYLYRLITG